MFKGTYQMNIFVLDLEPTLCAQYHNNRHVVKMVLESSQMLCTVMREKFGIDYGYKSTHKSHSCTVWTGENHYNFCWLKILGLELCKEYTYRYGKVHKCQYIIEEAYYPKHLQVPSLSLLGISMTPFSQCMPEQYKNIDPVVAYRDYYRNEKKHLLQYTKREMPKWL